MKQMNVVLSALLVGLGLFGVVSEFDWPLLWWFFIFAGLLYGFGSEDN